MHLRGIVLIGFSAACLGVSALAYKEDQRRAMSAGLASTLGAAYAACQANGIDTPFGRLGCIQTTSGAFTSGATRGLRDNRGGAVFIRN